jgi:DNA-binding winged helix-turn-helix (wHTH) protein
VFSGFRLEADGTLLRGHTPLPLPPRELGALRLLLAHAGRIVTPLEFKRALWGDAHVSADSISECLDSLRKLLEPDDCIRAVYKRGYCLTAEVSTFGLEPSAALPRLAILPFATESSAQEYLGAVVAEEVITRLDAVRPPIAFLLPIDSVFNLARRGLSPQQIGDALNADCVLGGTLRVRPSYYRLHVEMLRVKDSRQLWSEDLLVARSRIAAVETELVNRLTLRLNNPALSIFASAATPEEPEQAPQHRDAYEIFQRAHFEWQSLERHRMQDAQQRLLRATELDPSLVRARVDLAYLCVAQAFLGFMPPAVSADMARRNAHSILDIPARAEAIQPALGWISFHLDHNLPVALWWFANAAHLAHDPWITRMRTSFALSRMRFAEAIELLRAAIRLDPWSPWLQTRLAWAHHLAGEAALSVDQIRTALNGFPHHDETLLFAAIILAYNGESHRAVELAQGLAQRLPSFDLATAVEAYALAMAQRGDDARAILERLQWLSRERYVLRTFSPAVYVALGEHDAALSELQAAGEMRCPWIFQMLADPRLKPLRERPQFRSMQSILAGMEAEAERDSLGL